MARRKQNPSEGGTVTENVSDGSPVSENADEAAGLPNAVVGNLGEPQENTTGPVITDLGNGITKEQR